MSETTTPRTDAAAWDNGYPGTIVEASFARKLERDLAAANASRAQIGPLKARIAELNCQLDAALDAVKRRDAALDYALNCLRSHHMSRPGIGALVERVEKLKEG